MKLKYFNSIMCNSHLILLTAGVDMSFIGAALQKYVFGDIGYLKWLVMAMSVDLVTGITKVWKNDGFRAISSKGLRDTVAKCIQYGSFLIITHVLTHFEVAGKVQLSGMEWLNKVAYEFLILIEVKSVYENIVKINPALDFIDLVTAKLSSLLKEKKND